MGDGDNGIVMSLSVMGSDSFVVGGRGNVSGGGGVVALGVMGSFVMDSSLVMGGLNVVGLVVLRIDDSLGVAFDIVVRVSGSDVLRVGLVVKVVMILMLVMSVIRVVIASGVMSLVSVHLALVGGCVGSAVGTVALLAVVITVVGVLVVANVAVLSVFELTVVGAVLSVVGVKTVLTVVSLKGSVLVTLMLSAVLVGAAVFATVVDGSVLDNSLDNSFVTISGRAVCVVAIAVLTVSEITVSEITMLNDSLDNSFVTVSVAVRVVAIAMLAVSEITVLNDSLNDSFVTVTMTVAVLAVSEITMANGVDVFASGVVAVDVLSTFISVGMLEGSVLRRDFRVSGMFGLVLREVTMVVVVVDSLVMDGLLVVAGDVVVLVGDKGVMINFATVWVRMIDVLVILGGDVVNGNLIRGLVVLNVMRSLVVLGVLGVMDSGVVVVDGLVDGFVMRLVVGVVLLDGDNMLSGVVMGGLVDGVVVVGGLLFSKSDSNEGCESERFHDGMKGFFIIIITFFPKYLL